MEFLRPYFVAVHAFTRLPVTGALDDLPATPSTAAADPSHYPGVGLLVGAVACVAFAATGLLLHAGASAALSAAVACTVATTLVTGAMHERALQDLGDRWGRFGVLALVLVVLAKVSLLAVLDAHSPAAVMLALLGAHVVSRAWPLMIARTLPRGEGAPALGPIERRSLYEATAWCLVPLAAMAFVSGPAAAVLGLASSGAAAWWMKRALTRRAQAFDTDALGATQQLCEVAFYLAAAVGAR